jgi:organic radical activating enzyme
MRIRYSELFTSFQGEATYTGMPTVWLRFFGCNLECRGFGQSNPADPSTYVNEFESIDISNIKSMSELPVITKGCDSSYSWSAKFKHLAFDQNEHELAEQILRVGEEKLGTLNMIHKVTKRPIQLAFTGGEPMMQQKAMGLIMQQMVARMDGALVPQVTIETNGTKARKPEFDAVMENTDRLHFAISPKLFNVSGEKNAVDLDVIADYANIADSCAVKFVMNGSDEAWAELEKYEHALREMPVSLWIMPVGATAEQQGTEHIKEIAYKAMDRGYNIAARVHTYIFGNMIGS